MQGNPPLSNPPMHYIPESTRAFLEGEASAVNRSDEPSFHLASAPVYALTLVVGGLLLADVVIGLIDAPAWTPWRTVFGYRLALLAAVIGGARILYQTLEGLFQGRIGADFALTIACLSAILLGEHSVAALVVFIALVGESLEGYTVDRAAGAVRRIFKLCPRTAHVLRGGRELDLPVAELTIGDSVVIRPGERIPVDGKVTVGTSSVDQSALTGESLGLAKQPGDPVFAGTLNEQGWLTVEVEKLGEQTTFGKVVRLVAQSLARKAPMERTADRLARLFLPAVLTAALLTLLGWRIATGEWKPGWLPALGVLVVACPCPLILATPSAVMASMAWLARSGVIVKGSIALERLASVDLFAFDKTGTLTRGELQLGDVIAAEGLDETELLRLAAAAERRSEHPLARRIVAEADARNCVLPDVVEFHAEPGLGVRARLRATALGPLVESNEDGERHVTVLVGNVRFLESEGIALSLPWQHRLAELDEAGQTPLFVGLIVHGQPPGPDGDSSADAIPTSTRLLGMIGLRDTLRPEARQVLERLQADGITQFALLTGDRLPPARLAADAVGPLNFVEAGLLPAEKARWIEQQQQQGRRVAMVGDGVNDAPALAAATVGLALGSVGSDLAAEAGDVILMGDPLAPLPGLVRLSREFVKVVRQSIYLFAFGMNALGVLLCAWGVLSPVGGAIFHEFSSLAVMLNALRLLWFDRWTTTRFGRFSLETSNLAEWLVDLLSPSRAVYALLRNGSVLLRVGVAAACLWWFSSNFVLLGQDERALVTRCGKFQETLEPGWHFRWPYPFEQVLRTRIDAVRSLELGVRSTQPVKGTNGQFVAPVEWQSAHADQDAPSREEALLLAGDEVALELSASVQYRIRDLKQFSFETARPDQTLRAAAEHVLRGIVAHRSLDRMLAEDRGAVEAEALKLIQQAADEYRLGVQVTDLSLLDVHPPTAVVPSYRDVANAMEEREQSINQAQAEYARQVLSAAGEEAIRYLNQSSTTEGSSPLVGAPVDWRLDDALWKQLSNPPANGSKLSGTASAVLENARREKTLAVESARGSQARFVSLLNVFRQQPELTRLQLYWDAVETSLSQRAVTILDPQAAGRQHLILADPDQFTPKLLPLETPPISDPRAEEK